MIPLVRQIQHLARRWKFLFVPVCITAGMAFAVTWASGLPGQAPRETPSITLSDLDGDGDLDMLIESQTPLGQADGGAVDVFTNDGDRMTPLAIGLARRELDSGLGDLLPGYARWLAGADSDGRPAKRRLGRGRSAAAVAARLGAAAPERYDTKPSTLGDDYPEIRTLTMNFTSWPSGWLRPTRSRTRLFGGTGC